MPPAPVPKPNCWLKLVSFGVRNALLSLSTSTYSTFGSAAIWRISDSASTRSSLRLERTTSAPVAVRRTWLTPSDLPAADADAAVVSARLVGTALPSRYLTMKRSWVVRGLQAAGVDMAGGEGRRSKH